MKSYPAGFGPNDHRCVVWLWKGIYKLHIKVTQHNGQDRLDLQVGKVGAHASMSPSTKTNEGERLLQQHHESISTTTSRALARRGPECDFKSSQLARCGAIHVNPQLYKWQTGIPQPARCNQFVQNTRHSSFTLPPFHVCFHRVSQQCRSRLYHMHRNGDP